MKRYFLDAAQSEFDAAIDNYDAQRFGLGIEFEGEVEQALERIDNYPEAWSPLSSRVRRCLLNRFPYSVIYELRSESIMIVAIQHHHQKPESWRSRIIE
jgi:plasmid stabilization system protein ParE